jgi:hypothetical protein
MIKLYAFRREGQHHVRVVEDGEWLRQHKLYACFKSRKLTSTGWYGTIVLPDDAYLPLVIHEIAHAAMHCVGYYISRDRMEQKTRKTTSDQEWDEHREECVARIVESMTRQYIEKVVMK